ncbi:Ecd family [Dillenia turbinata]|uniref:Ecd family n=1 Tax=Dillenia turbinata TaxID=194707 RepID=A0AAN8UXS0_9MAGN
MSDPVRRIDEILALPHNHEIPPLDDDLWLYNGDDELNAAIMERQKETELYESKHKKMQKSKEPSFPAMREPRNLEGVDFYMDRFIKDLESAMRHPEHEGAADDDDTIEGSLSNMDFESEDGSKFAEACEDIEDGEDAFKNSYSDALNKELKPTTLKKSFVRANDQFTNKNEVDEMMLSLLDSFSSRHGLPGPASNLLGFWVYSSQKMPKKCPQKQVKCIGLHGVEPKDGPSPNAGSTKYQL